MSETKVFQALVLLQVPSFLRAPYADTPHGALVGQEIVLYHLQRRLDPLMERLSEPRVVLPAPDFEYAANVLGLPPEQYLKWLRFDEDDRTLAPRAWHPTLSGYACPVRDLPSGIQAQFLLTPDGHVHEANHAEGESLPAWSARLEGAGDRRGSFCAR